MIQVEKKLFAVCGSPIKHSLSPNIFKKLFEKNNILATYSRILTNSASDAIYLFDELGLSGMNVTSPLKKSIKKYCNCEKSAGEIDAVNTIVRQNGKFLGFNTDWEGVLFSFYNAKIDLENKNILVIGAGSAASSAIYSIQKFNKKSKITILNKSEKNAQNLAKKYEIPFFVAEKLQKNSISNFNSDFNIINFDIIIATIPNPQDYLSEVEFGENQILFFADYKNQEYFSSLRKKVKQVISGENWLKNQAFSAFEYFMKSDDLCKNIDFSDLISNSNSSSSNQNNIFLTGFSGSGKTTIGEKLAKKLQKKFIDTDKIIEKEAGKSILQIFETEGENAFRSYETQLLNEITNAKNAVISLGGGTILNPENQKIIEKMSGIITYIYSDFETSISRIDLPALPLLKNKNINEIEFLFNERKTKYFENSDLIISNNKTIIPALNKLYQEFS